MKVLTILAALLRISQISFYFKPIQKAQLSNLIAQKDNQYNYAI